MLLMIFYIKSEQFQNILILNINDIIKNSEKSQFFSTNNKMTTLGTVTVQQTSRSLTNNEDHHNYRFCKCLKKIEQRLCKYPFRDKIYDLTKSNVFYFDVYNVVGQSSCEAVKKLCYKFFYFMAAKMVIRIWQEKQMYQQDCLSKQYQNSQTINSEVPKRSLWKNSRVLNSREQLKWNISQSKARATTLTQSLSNNSVNNIYNIRDSIQKQKQCQDYNSQQHKWIKKLTMKTKSDKKNTIQSEISYLGHDVQGLQGNQETILADIIVKISDDIKQAYFELNQSFRTKKRVQKIQIITFLIALMSPYILHPIVQVIESQLSYKMPQQPNPSPNSSLSTPSSMSPCSSFVEEQIYIILTYHTLGNLISSTVFSSLKKKYIKQTIFVTQGNIGYYKLARSLKFIKGRLLGKDVMVVKGRRERVMEMERLVAGGNCVNNRASVTFAEDNPFSIDKMKKFIKQALKVNNQLDFATTSKNIKPYPQQLQNINNKLQQSFYPSPTLNTANSTSKRMTNNKLSIVKESPINKCSVSIKTKLNLQSIKHNKAEDSKKRYYLQNYQKTFYKIKNVGQKQRQKQRNASIKNIKTERNTHKFSKIIVTKKTAPNMDTQTKIEVETVLNMQSNSKIRDKKKDIQKQQSIDHIKKRLKQFKQHVLHDKENIQLFKPFKCKQEKIGRESFQNHSAPLDFLSLESTKYINERQHHNQRLADEQKITSSLKQRLTDKQCDKQVAKLKQRKSDKQRQEIHKQQSYEKQQVWHHMYNIKQNYLPSRLSTKVIDANKNNKYNYKLTKTSEKLRKDKIQFMENCKVRDVFLYEDEREKQRQLQDIQNRKIREKEKDRKQIQRTLKII